MAQCSGFRWFLRTKIWCGRAIPNYFEGAIDSIESRWKPPAMNLSCGKCKSIRPFSGNPPKCDVCGWVCGTLESESFGSPLKEYARRPHVPRASKSTETFEGFGCLLGLVVVAAIAYGIYYFRFMPDSEYLSSKYNVPIERVDAAPKPHGCAFNDAPLGDKHCHFEKHVYVFDKDNQVIEIDGTPRKCPAGCGPAYRVQQDFQRVDE